VGQALKQNETTFRQAGLFNNYNKPPDY